MNLPKRTKVKKLISGRYGGGKRPLSWDERISGLDEILTSEDEKIILDSNGDQSCPEPGWDILLTSSGKSPGTFKWTLYGISN